MDKITEEIIVNLIKRVEKIEEKMEKIKEFPKKPVWKTNPNKPATEKQIIAVSKRGGEIWKGMTQGDIEEQFKLIDQRKNSQQESQKRNDSVTSFSGSKIQPVGKILTKEEIDGLPDEAFL